MIRNLIRSKAFNNSRLFGDSWRIILDGTGLFHFKERHCENCLKTTKTNEDGTKTTSYYHKVLEAKIILADNIVISLGTEFIENENEVVAKQDCEQNAAKRLLNRIKKQYSRLNICILGDSLYAAQSIMGICRKHNWKYILNCKSGSQKNIIKDYEYIKSDIIVHKDEIEFLNDGASIYTIGNEEMYIKNYDSVTCDKQVTEKFDLHDYGFDAYVLHTPGHSIGSTSVIVDNEIAIVCCDALGGFDKKPFSKTVKRVPDTILKSLEKLIDLKCSLYLPAHKYQALKYNELVELYKNYLTLIGS